MSGNFTKTLFVCLLLILTNISANADSPKIRWSNTNKTIAPEMIQVSDDGNYLHTLQNNYYKKIDLNTDSIVKVVDLKQVCIRAVKTLTEFNDYRSIGPQYYFNYPNITLLFRAQGTQYVIYYNIETEDFYVVEYKYGVTYLTSNENYTILYFFTINIGKDYSLRFTSVYLWDYKKKTVKKIFTSNGESNLVAGAGLYKNEQYWIYSSKNGLQLFNAENDSLIRSGSAGIDTYFIANYKSDGEELYFLTYDNIPTGKKINLETMKAETNNGSPFYSDYLKSNNCMNVTIYMGYISLKYKPSLIIYDLKKNLIREYITDSIYFKTFDIDTIKNVIYYIDQNNIDEIKQLNLNSDSVDKKLLFNTPVTNYKIGKEILSNINLRAFSKYTLLNTKDVSEISHLRIDTLNLDDGFSDFFYDSLLNNYYPVFFKNNHYQIWDYQKRKIINDKIELTLYSTYYLPVGIHLSNNKISILDIVNNTIIGSTFLYNINLPLKSISRNGNSICFFQRYYKNYYFFDLNENQEYKYPWFDYTANYIEFIGNSGNFITQNGKQVILRNFKEPQDSIILGTTNSLITTSTFSNNERMIITGDVTGKIIFWNLLTNSKSYELDLNMDIKKIDLTLDEKGLLVLTGDCSLTMIDVEDILITEVKEKDNITSDICISPNPATDFITINPGNKVHKPFAETDEQVEIYNSFGELVLADIQHLRDVAHLRSIDISHLPVGLYFIKIGDRVEKFVKM